eukprot:SAG31_NODE_15380_length_758_cov_0.779970_1_plen_110_part_00
MDNVAGITQEERYSTVFRVMAVDYLEHPHLEPAAACRQDHQSKGDSWSKIAGGNALELFVVRFRASHAALPITINFTILVVRQQAIIFNVMVKRIPQGDNTMSAIAGKS